MNFFSRHLLRFRPRLLTLSLTALVMLGFLSAGIYWHLSDHDDVSIGQPDTMSAGKREKGIGQPRDLTGADQETSNELANRGRSAVVPTTTAANWSEIDDPIEDGWTIESRADQAKHALERIVRFAIGNQSLPDDTPSPSACTDDYRGSVLVPSQLEEVFSDGPLHVHRWQPAKTDELRFHGQAGFKQTIEQISASWASYREVEFEFKVVRALENDGILRTRQHTAAQGRSDRQVMEQHATWETVWRIADQSDLRLKSLRLIDFEQSTYRQPHRLFSDCAESILGHNDCYRSQLQFGLNYWLERNQDMRYFSPLGTPGMAVADVNGDGLDDLYLCQEANLPNRLFLQRPDGTADDVSAEWRVDFLHGSRSALFVDLDNDGDQDLAVAILGGIILAANTGDLFVVRDVLPTSDDTMSLTASDFDGDADLDLYVCVDYPNETFVSARNASEVGSRVQGGAANRIYHDANNAGPNSLFRNDLDPQRPDVWNFTDVTDLVGLGQNNQRFSWAACWEDYDNDGDPDLYVANDFGRNNLYRNQGGQFEDVAGAAGVENRAAGMSVTWGDVDRDGWMDLYVSNMFSAAGSRVTEQPIFKQGESQQMKKRWRQFALGNALFRNLGESRFHDISSAAGVRLGRWAWSSNFVDVNNDGWLDLAVANGYITSHDKSDL